MRASWLLGGTGYAAAKLMRCAGRRLSDEPGLTSRRFALSNGHVGLRGNLDEGEPTVSPGTYLNGFYEIRPLPHAEAATAIPRRARR
jgi:hypothetical protein